MFVWMRHHGHQDREINTFPAKYLMLYFSAQTPEVTSCFRLVFRRQSASLPLNVWLFGFWQLVMTSVFWRKAPALFAVHVVKELSLLPARYQGPVAIHYWGNQLLRNPQRNQPHGRLISCLPGFCFFSGRAKMLADYLDVINDTIEVLLP